MSNLLFASALRLDRKDCKALHMVDSYSLHRVVYSLFEDIRSEQEKIHSAKSGIVYADQGGDFFGRRILMLSDRKPKTCITIEKDDTRKRPKGHYGEVESKQIASDFLQHNHYRFKIIINPTKRENVNRKITPIKGRDDISHWFCEKALANWGFSVPKHKLQIDKIQVDTFKDKHQRDVTITKAYLSGVLKVEDHTIFAQSFASGIGRARSFGCGLLQIVPID